MVYYLAAKYNINNSAANNAWVDFLEVMNEPNFRWWPQTTSDGRKLLHLWAAQMLDSARNDTRYLGNQPIILGPTLSDTVGSPSTRGYDEFMTATLDRLRELDFPALSTAGDDYVAWSHHNYGDLEYPNSPLLGSSSRSYKVREKLKQYGWRGWPYHDATNPYVLITEGGARIDQVGGELNQSNRISAVWNDLYGRDGMGMITNYEMWSAGTFDSGLCDIPAFDPNAGYPYGEPGQCNPERVVFNTWPDLPTTTPRPSPQADTCA